MQNDIHVTALARAQSDEARRQIIKAHYQRQALTGVIRPKNKSALLRSQSNGNASIHAIFGGQGNNKSYFEELRIAYNTYQPLVEDFVAPLAKALHELSLDQRIQGQYPEGLDVLAWLQDKNSTPSADYLNSAPVSFPLIGLLQLVQLTTVFVALGCGPEDLPSLFKGFTGHSQGVVVAAAAAEATNWPDFQEAALKAITILFWVGARCQQSFSEAPLADERRQQLESYGCGTPSPMLAISGFPRHDFEKAISEINGFLPGDIRMAVSVINSSDEFVVSGPQETLAALVDAFMSISSKKTQVAANPSIRFLPITVPCNCFLLSEVVNTIEEDLKDITIRAASLRLPINQHADGADLRAASHNLIPTLIRLITSEQVDWTRADFVGITHLVDFGPGDFEGIGALIRRRNASSVPRVLIASQLETPAEPGFGAITELFNHRDELSLRSNRASIHSIGSFASSESCAGSFDIASMGTEELRALLSGDFTSWRSALFSSPTVSRDGAIVPNPVQKLIFSAAADKVEISENRYSFYRNGDLVLYVSHSDDDGITVMPFTWVTASNKLISLAIKFEYHADAPETSIREVTEDRDQRVYDMYRQLWLGDVAECSATEQGGSPENNVFEGSFVIRQDRVAAFSDAAGYKAADVPMDFAVVAAWKPISQALLQDPVQGDLLALVHLSNSYDVAADAEPLEIGDALITRAYVASITIGDAGKTVEVVCEIRRAESGALALTVRSRFLFKGSYGDFSSTFSRTVADKFEVTLKSAGDQAVLLSKPWFSLVGHDDLDKATLEFHVETCTRFKAKGVNSSIETSGNAYIRSEDGELNHIAVISNRELNTQTNSVIMYLLRAGKSLGHATFSEPTTNDTATAATTAPAGLSQVLSLVIPEPSEDTSLATGDVNPSHSSPMFAALVDLPGNIARGTYCSAAVRGLLEEHISASGEGRERVQRYEVAFAAGATRVQPGEELEATFTTTATTPTARGAAADGPSARVIAISVTRASSGEVLLSGEALVADPTASVVVAGEDHPCVSPTAQSPASEHEKPAAATDLCISFPPSPPTTPPPPPPSSPLQAPQSAPPPPRRPRMPSFRRSLSGDLGRRPLGAAIMDRWMGRAEVRSAGIRV